VTQIKYYHSSRAKVKLGRNNNTTSCFNYRLTYIFSAYSVNWSSWGGILV